MHQRLQELLLASKWQFLLSLSLALLWRPLYTWKWQRQRRRHRALYARDSAAGTVPICASVGRQSLLGGGRPLAVERETPLQPIGEVLPWRGPPSRSPQARAPLQTWSTKSLVKFLWSRSGPWQAGSWCPGFHYADSSPRAHDAHGGIFDRGEASWAQTCLPGP